MNWLKPTPILLVNVATGLVGVFSEQAFLKSGDLLEPEIILNLIITDSTGRMRGKRL